MSNGWGPSDPRQDFSLVFDQAPSEGAVAHDRVGPSYQWRDKKRAKHTSAGFLQTVGSTTSAAPAGFWFGANASIDTLGRLHCTGVSTNQGTWLNNPGNLAGGLVWQNPDGQATMHISAAGAVSLRARHFKGMGGF